MRVGEHTVTSAAVCDRSNLAAGPGRQLRSLSTYSSGDF